MNKSDRLKIITIASGIKSPTISELQLIIDSYVLDELKYAGIKSLHEHSDIQKEFNKVLETYSFNGYCPSPNVINYIKHYSLFPELAAMQHCDLNDSVSNIGIYYDGTPTSKYRKKDRFKIEPICLELLKSK